MFAKSKLPSKSDNMRKPRKKAGRGMLIALACFIAVSLVGGWIFSDWYRSVPDSVVAEYVGRESCIECHQTQHDLFHGSHHDKAMDLATEETVLANFDDQTLEHHGVESRFFRQDKKFMVHTEGPDGKMSDFEVKYVFGVEPLQQYMVELKPASKKGAIGEVQVLRLSWDTAKKKWFYLAPPDVKDKLETDDPLHWTGITQNWNSNCAFCHSTNLQKNFHVASDTFNTTFSEIDVSCEACHGPGSVHVDLANRKNFFWDRKRGLGLHKLKTESNVTQVETCAPCHSRRREIKDGYFAGCNFNDYFDVSVMQGQLYHCDGQIRDEVYVYGSFIQSKMYHQNIKCTDCHDPHSTRLKYEGNQLCTSCHQHPASKYDDPSHHHHQPGSPGAQCVECHMPSTTYMAVDARRDHSLRVPRPDLSLVSNAPNACTGCHLQPEQVKDEITREQLTQYLDWIILKERGNQEVADILKQTDQQMADALKKWFPNSERPEHYGLAFDQARKDASKSANLMRPLITRKSNTGFVRASAAVALAPSVDEASYAASLRALDDPDPIVAKAGMLRVENEILYRLNSIQSAQADPAQLASVKNVFDRVAETLAHRSRVVRIEAARVLTQVPKNLRNQWLDNDQKKQFHLAFDEMIDSLKMADEQGASHRTLGSLYETVSEYDLAIQHYKIAIQLQPSLQGPRWNLSLLYEQQAEQIARSAQQMAQNGMTEQAQKQLAEAQEWYGKAAAMRDEEHQILLNDLARLEGIGPTDRLHYQVGMSYYRRRNLEKTEFHLLKAYELQPRNEQYVLALATFYHAKPEPFKALRYADELLQINPQNQSYHQLRKEIRNQSP